MEKQIKYDDAVAIHDSGIWKEWTSEQVVKFQLFQDLLCMPFDHFHKCIQEVLDRPVFTHEFMFRDELIKEFIGEKEPPTFEEILSLIPKDKLIIASID